jgi:hypothetical protein
VVPEPVSGPRSARSLLVRLRAWPLWVWPAAAGLAIHLLTAALRLNAFLPRPEAYDLRAFYTQAWALRQGAPLYGWPAAFLDGLRAAWGLPLDVPPSNSLPLTAVVYLPLTLFSFPTAAVLWLALMLAVLALCALPLARLAGVRGAGAVALVWGLAVVYGPTYLGLTLGQNAVLSLLALLALGAALHHPGAGRRATGRWIVATLALLPPLWLKLWPAAVAAVLPLWRPRWRGFVVLGVLLLALLLNGVLLPEASRAYLSTLWPDLWGRFAGAAGLEDQSLTAWLLRLFQPQQYTVSGLDVSAGAAVAWTPVVALPLAAVRWGGYALLAALGIAVVWRALHAGDDREGALYLWALFVVLAAAHVERYNHVLLLPAMAWLWGRGRRGAVSAAVLLTGLARLTHLWALWLPGSAAALLSGAGTLAALWLALAMLRALRPAPDASTQRRTLDTAPM